LIKIKILKIIIFTIKTFLLATLTKRDNNFLIYYITNKKTRATYFESSINNSNKENNLKRILKNNNNNIQAAEFLTGLIIYETFSDDRIENRTNKFNFAIEKTEICYLANKKKKLLVIKDRIFQFPFTKSDKIS